MPISAELDLDITAALDAVGRLQDALASSLTDAASGFGQALGDAVANLVINVDTSQLQDAVSAVAEAGNQSVVIPIEADPQALFGSIDAAIADANANPLPIQVPIDIENFVGSIDNALQQAQADATANPIEISTSTAPTDIFGSSSPGGSAAASNIAGVTEGVGAIELLKGATSSLGSAAALAEGDIAPLSASIGGLSSGAGAAAGGIGALAAAVAGFTAEGERGVAATQRLNLVFGDQANAIKQINLGGLTGDLDQLALQAGSVSPKVDQAVASLGFLAQNSGFTSTQTKELVNNFSGLALQAVAMKPALGDVGDVVNSLVPALSRGGRFALQFGLALDSADINALALAETGKTSAASLTALEKAFAGAEIAAGKLGDNIGTNFQNGIQQTAVQFKSLKATIEQTLIDVGTPFVQPVLDLLKGLAPIAEGIAQLLGTTLGGLVPLVASIAQGVTDAFSKLKGPLGDVGKSFGDLLISVAPIAQVLGAALVPAAAALAPALEAVAKIVEGLASALSSIPGPILAIAAAAVVAGPVLDFLATSIFALGGAIDVALAAFFEFEVPLVAIAAVFAALSLTGKAIPGTFVDIGVAALAAGAAVTALSGEAVTLGAAFDVALGPVGLVIAAVGAVASILGIFDGATKQATLDTQSLGGALFGSSTTVKDLSDKLNELNTNETIYLATALNTGKNADTNKQVIDRLGLSYDGLAKSIATLSTVGFIDFVAGIEKSGKAAGLSQDEIDRFTQALHTQRDTLEATSDARLQQLVATGAITQAQLDAIKVQDGLNEAQAGGSESVGNYSKALADATKIAHDNTQANAASSQAFQFLGQALASGAITAADLASQATDIGRRFGVSAEQIVAFSNDVVKAVNTFEQTLISALPSITSFFQTFATEQDTAFKNLVSANNNLAKAEETATRSLTTGLDSQRNAVSSAGDKLTQAQQKLSDAQQKVATAGFNATTQEQVSSQIASANQAVATASAGVTNATDTYNKARQSLSDASSKAQATLADAQKKQADAANALKVAIAPETFTKELDDELKALQNFDKNIKTLIGEGNSNLAESLLQLGPKAGAGIARGFVEAGPIVAKGANTAVKGVADELGKIITDFGPGSKFGVELPGAVSAIADTAAKEFGITLGKSGAKSAETALDSIIRTFGVDSPEFKKATAAGGAFSQAVTGLLLPEDANTIIKKRGSALSDSDRAALRKEAQDNIDKIQRDVSDSLTKALSKAATDANSAAQDAGANIIDGLAAGITKQDKPDEGAQGAVSSAAQKIIDKVKTKLRISSPSGVFQDIGADIVGGLAVGIETTFTSLLPIVESLAADLSDTVVSEARPLGQAIGAGIAIGMTDLIPAVEATARLLVERAETAAADQGKIKSPSEVFRTIGQQISQGLTLGIMDGQQATAAAAATVVQAAHDAARETIRHNGAALATIGTQTVAPSANAAISSELRVAPSATVLGFDAQTSVALRNLAGTLDRAVKATRPIEITQNEKADPLHVGAELAFQLTR